jgi:hypothetical protein
MGLSTPGTYSVDFLMIEMNYDMPLRRTNDLTVQVQSVPLPGSLLLFVSGVFGLNVFRVKKKG